MFIHNVYHNYSCFISSYVEHGQEAYSQDGQAPLSPVLPHVGPDARFYAQSYPKQATESSGSWMPSQHAEHSCGGHGGLPLLYSISNAGADKFGRTKIVMQLPRPPIGQYQSIILNPDSIALSGLQGSLLNLHPFFNLPQYIFTYYFKMKPFINFLNEFVFVCFNRLQSRGRRSKRAGTTGPRPFPSWSPTCRQPTIPSSAGHWAKWKIDA